MNDDVGQAAPSVGDVIERSLPALRAATGLRCVFGGATERGPSGLDQVVIDRLAGMQTTAMNGLTVVCGQGLGGQAILHRRPVVVRDYTSSRRITHEHDDPVVGHEGLTSIVAVPVPVADRMMAVVYCATRGPGSIGDAAVNSAVDVARRIGREVAVLLPAFGQPGSTRRPADLRALADLAVIMQNTTNPDLRFRLRRIHAQLTSGVWQSQGRRPLPRREVDVLHEVATGATNVQVAERLGLSPESVKTYLRNAMRKLGVTNRTAAVHEARDRRLI